MKRKLETDLVSIGCPELRRAGLFAEGVVKLTRWNVGVGVVIHGGVDQLRFDDVPIPLVYSPCHYGGRRPSMLSPCCGRRSRRLFLDEGTWKCRPCANFRYLSTATKTYMRPHLQLQRIDERLAWAQRPWHARLRLARRAKVEAKLKAMR